MTVVKLKAEAKRHRHRGYSKLRKAEFAKLLENPIPRQVEKATLLQGTKAS